MTNEELAISAQSGNYAAALQLWEQVQRLVRFKAIRRLPEDGHTSRIELEDLMQAGYIAMMASVKDFSTESGYAFTTYLTHHLKTAFARELGIRTTRRDALLKAVSIDAPLSLGSDDDLTIADTLEAPNEKATIDDLLNRIDTERAFNTVMEYMERLNLKDAEVIRKHYLEGLSLRQIAAQYGVAFQVVRQHEMKGFRKLRGYTAIRKIGRELYADEHTYFYLHIGVQAFQSGSGSAVELLAERRDIAQWII